MTLLTTSLAALLLATPVTSCAAEPLRLENDKLALGFDAASGALTAVENKLTGEIYSVSGDKFAIEAVEGDVGFARLKPVAVKLTGDTLAAQYQGAGLTVEVRHRLGASLCANMTETVTSSSITVGGGEATYERSCAERPVRFEQVYRCRPP